MQFLILLTGVLVFVFYHFEPAAAALERGGDAKAGEAGAAGGARVAAGERFEAAARPPAAARRTRPARGDAGRAARLPGGARRMRARRTREAAPSRWWRLSAASALQRHELHLSVLHAGHGPARRPRRPRHRGHLRGRDVDALRRVQLARHRDHGGLLPALRAGRRRATPTTCWCPGSSPRSWGGFACLVALQAGKLGSAIEVVNRFGSYFYGSILGVFGLAILTPRASARGAFYGLIAGMAAVVRWSRGTRPCTSSGTTWWAP